MHVRFCMDRVPPLDDDVPSTRAGRLLPLRKAGKRNDQNGERKKRTTKTPHNPRLLSIAKRTPESCICYSFPPHGDTPAEPTAPATGRTLVLPELCRGSHRSSD